MHEDDVPPVRAVKRSETVRLPQGAEACPMARAWASDLLAPMSMAQRVIDDVVLCLDELVSNVVIHTLSSPVVTLTIHDGVLVEVADTSRTSAAMRERTGEPGGWGLRIVDNIADRWGSEMKDTGGKVVWFTIAT